MSEIKDDKTLLGEATRAEKAREDDIKEREDDMATCCPTYDVLFLF